MEGITTMNVLMINGSPHPHGTTRRALDEIAGTLERAYQIETEIMTVGQETIHGCIGCGRCKGQGTAWRLTIR